MKIFPDAKLLSETGRGFLLRQRVHIFLPCLAALVLFATAFDSYAISSVPMLRTVAAVMGISLSLLWAVTRARSFQISKGPLSWVLLFVAVMVYVDLARYVSTGDFSAANFMQWLQPLILTIILIDIGRDYRSVPVIALGFFAAIAFTAFLAMVGASGDQGRVGASIFNLNVQSYFFGMVAVPLLVYGLSKWPKVGVSGILSLLGALFFLLLVVRTGSRGGLVAAVMGVSWVLVLMLRRRNVVAYVTLIPAILLCAGFIFANSAALDRWKNTVEGEDYGYRDVVWSASVELVKERPFLGHGAGFVNEMGLYLAMQEIDYTEAVTGISTHNQYLMLLAAYGVVGLTVWALVVFSVFIRCWRLRRHPIAVACMGMIVCSIFYGISGDIMFRRYFWAVVAVSANIGVVVMTFPYDGKVWGYFPRSKLNG